MSNETIKLEADCAVATYNHHHHHHHHQNPHLQLHHNPIAHHQVHHVLTSAHGPVPSPSPTIKAGVNRDAPCERLTESSVDEDEEQENKHYNNDFKSTSSSSPELIACNRSLMHTTPMIDDIKLSGASPMTQNDHSDYLHQALNHSLVVTSGDKYTQLESVNPQQIIQRDAIQTTQYQIASTTKFSSSSDSSESSEDDEVDSEDSEGDEEEQVVGDNDDEYGDEDDDEDDEEEEDDDEEEEDEEDVSQDQDCDDIVDPVGHHHHYMHHQNSNCNGQTIINGTYQSAISGNESNSDDDDDDDDEDDDDDVSFENEPDEAATLDSSPSDLSLNSDRMLEVTRKLVRSTERDPDRDLRKQVLLRTAIRRLPHFMESSCNHYSDTFDQNFRLHNNTINENNGSTLECLSPSQYYENHNIYHLESTQPKSYYHSVQPNAIQMSTTSLRMLDLNDDQDSEIVIQPSVSDSIDSPTTATTTTTKHPNQHLISYDNTDHENHHTTQSTTTSLEQQHQHEYANSNIYNTYSHHHHHHHHHHHPPQQHENQINQLQDLDSLIVPGDQRTVMHDFNQYNNVDQHLQGPSSSIIARHDTLDSLYQPLSDSGSGNDIGNEVKSATAQPAAFQNVHDYGRVVISPDHQCYNHTDGGAANSNENRPISSEMDIIMDQSLASSTTAIVTTETTESNKPIDDNDVLDLDEAANSQRNDKDDLNNNHDHPREENDCRHHHKATITVYNDTLEPTKSLEDPSTDECIPVSPPNEFLDETAIPNRLNDEDQTANCLDGGSSSSQSSTSSDDSVNSSTQSNDSAGDSNGTSILETSLNTTNDFHYRSHDSGVVLYIPKSNKRTSSSIGLDDEMDIDHMSSEHHHHMSSSNQIFTGSVANHCKRLRKKEIID